MKGQEGMGQDNVCSGRLVKKVRKAFTGGVRRKSVYHDAGLRSGVEGTSESAGV